MNLNPFRSRPKLADSFEAAIEGSLHDVAPSGIERVQAACAVKYLDLMAIGELRELAMVTPYNSGWPAHLLVRKFIPWLLGTYPDRRVLLAAPSHSIARSWARWAKESFEAEIAPSTDLALDPWDSSPLRFDLFGAKGGLCLMGGREPANGRPYDFIIFLQGHEQPRAQQEGDWDHFISTVKTRGLMECAILVVAPLYTDICSRWVDRGTPLLTLAGARVER